MSHVKVNKILTSVLNSYFLLLFLAVLIFALVIYFSQNKSQEIKAIDTTGAVLKLSPSQETVFSFDKKTQNAVFGFDTRHPLGGLLSQTLFDVGKYSSLGQMEEISKDDLLVDLVGEKEVISLLESKKEVCNGPLGTKIMVSANITLTKKTKSNGSIPPGPFNYRPKHPYYEARINKVYDALTIGCNSN